MVDSTFTDLGLSCSSVDTGPRTSADVSRVTPALADPTTVEHSTSVDMAATSNSNTIFTAASSISNNSTAMASKAVVWAQEVTAFSPATEVDWVCATAGHHKSSARRTHSSSQVASTVGAASVAMDLVRASEDVTATLTADSAAATVLATVKAMVYLVADSALSQATATASARVLAASLLSVARPASAVAVAPINRSLARVLPTVAAWAALSAAGGERAS